ncbi:MAG: GNAT family N-acetyltransferase, partial [Nanoarchaeota archaeon]
REIGLAIRELGIENINKNLKLKITKYNASKGQEYFIEITNNQDILFGLLRLRLFKDKENNQRAIIRELHVYGQSLKLKQKSQELASQHKGFGKQLLKKAEEICKQKNVSDIKIISGVGVREYYKRLGYNLTSKEDGEYMIKYIN